jgi:hypothetical protein
MRPSMPNAQCRMPNAQYQVVSGGLPRVATITITITIMSMSMKREKKI